jgi:hypothetical protein
VEKKIRIQAASLVPGHVIRDRQGHLVVKDVQVQYGRTFVAGLIDQERVDRTYHRGASVVVFDEVGSAMYGGV